MIRATFTKCCLFPLCRLRYLGHPVWKEIEQNRDIMWDIYGDMIRKRKVTCYLYLIALI